MSKLKCLMAAVFLAGILVAFSWSCKKLPILPTVPTSTPTVTVPSGCVAASSSLVMNYVLSGNPTPMAMGTPMTPIPPSPTPTITLTPGTGTPIAPPYFPYSSSVTTTANPGVAILKSSSQWTNYWASIVSPVPAPPTNFKTQMAIICPYSNGNGYWGMDLGNICYDTANLTIYLGNGSGGAACIFCPPPVPEYRVFLVPTTSLPPLYIITTVSLP